MAEKNTIIARLLLNSENLTKDEKDFIDDLDKVSITHDRRIQTSAILTQFYVAKLSERTAEKSEKSSKVIKSLTWVLAVAAVVQAGAAVLMYLSAK